MNGPGIVRSSPPPYFTKPGLHSHNANRRPNRSHGKFATLLHIRVLLLLLGLCGVGYYGYTLTDQYVYQAFQNWAFDQQIAGRPAVNFADYLREMTPFGFLAGAKNPATSATTSALSPGPSAIPRPVEGSLLGRVEIPRLNLSAIVREGVDAKTLRVAVGHVPSTSLPGEPGNFAIAAHRDTLFRGLKDIRKDDLVTFQSPATTYTYKVISTKIVKPSDISVLQPDGGGLTPIAQASSSNAAGRKLLTMITCYPFYYVGSAPKRFIVQAKLVSTNGESKLVADQAGNASPPQEQSATYVAAAAVKHRSAKQARTREPRRVRGSSREGASHSRRVASVNKAAGLPENEPSGANCSTRADPERAFHSGKLLLYCE